jgi:FkbM family methyltransferase
MNFKSLSTRVIRIAKFTKEAFSLSAIPGLVVAAIARDNPFGHTGIWSTTLGRCIGIVSVRTCAARGESALIDTHDLGHLISCEEVLIENIYDFSRVPFSPEVIVDCGAHIGLFSLVAGLRYSSAKLIAFEPNSSNFGMARLQLARFQNRLCLVEAAVSTKNGQGWLCDAESNTGYLCDRSQRGQSVRLINLGTEATCWSGKRLLLKMDIEGAERYVLPNVIDHLPRQSTIFFEVHGGRNVWEELANALSVAGFHAVITRTRRSFVDGFASRS